MTLATDTIFYAAFGCQAGLSIIGAQVGSSIDLFITRRGVL